MALEKRPFLHLDRGLLLFGIKFTLASIIALGISLWSSLPDPKWSIITVVVLAYSNTDQVTAKSLIRIVGTVIGASVGLTLAATFSEHRVLFILFLCLWLGLCQWLTVWFRDLEAYMFALSGYTAAIVGIPGVLSPYEAPDIAVSRASQVCIGIAATWVASALIFPKFEYNSLPNQIRDATTRLRASFQAGSAGAASRTQLAALFAALQHYGRTIAMGDPTTEQRVRAVRSLNRALMNNLFLSRVLARPECARPDMMALVEALPDAIQDEQAALSAQQQWEEASHKLDAEIRNAGANTAHAYIAVPWLHFSHMCRQLLIGYRAVLNRDVKPIPVSGPFHVAGADSIQASVATLQTMTCTALLCTFWILAEWQSAPGAIIMVIVNCLLLLDSSGYKAIIWGVVVAIVPALVVAFQIVPLTTTFPMMALAIAPFLLASFMVMGLGGNYRMAGINATLPYLSCLSLENVMTYDFATALDGVIALLVSFSVGAVVFAIVFPTTPRLMRLRLMRSALRVMRRTTTDNVERGHRSQMRLTFLSTQLAAFFQHRPHPYRETEAAFAAGLLANAFTHLHDEVQPQDPWALHLQQIRDLMASSSLLRWRSTLELMKTCALNGTEQARQAMAQDESGRACAAVAAFDILLQSLNTLSGLTLEDPLEKPAPAQPATPAGKAAA